MASNVLPNIQDNIDMLKNIFKNSADVVFNEFQAYSGANAVIIYIDGLVTKEILNRDVITPFILSYKNDDVKKCIHTSDVTESKSIEGVVQKIINFQAVIFIEDVDTAYIIDAKGWDKRAIEEPNSEIVIRGPKEGFVESIRINTSLIRRKIKNSNLIFESLKLGKQTQTDIVIGYIEGIVNVDILNEVRLRLNKIEIDGVLESGYIEQYIEDAHYSQFPTVGNTQKPDIAAAKLLEGRVVILCDGTPHVLTVPHLFIENMQSSEDYYISPILATVLRILRVGSLFLTILLPALYVAIQNFHQEMIPTTLLIRMAAAREGLPFPALIEAFFMITMFELLRESGTRLPRQVGSAISIVGALVIGEAAVSAGLVSGTMVIVISITAITGFIVSSLTELIIIYRFIFLFLSGFLGLYGITCGLFIVIAHVVSLKSFTVPYVYPIAPFNKEGMKDFISRFPLKYMIKRPKFIARNNRKRRGKS